MQRRSAWFPRLFVRDARLALFLFSSGYCDCFAVSFSMDSRCGFFGPLVGNTSDNVTDSGVFELCNTIMLSMSV